MGVQALGDRGAVRPIETVAGDQDGLRGIDQPDAAAAAGRQADRVVGEGEVGGGEAEVAAGAVGLDVVGGDGPAVVLQRVACDADVLTAAWVDADRGAADVVRGDVEDDAAAAIDAELSGAGDGVAGDAGVGGVRQDAAAAVGGAAVAAEQVGLHHERAARDGDPVDLVVVADIA